ncbi:MAG: RHS repeat domain-containing protein, partial [Terriglobales bacterium]
VQHDATYVGSGFTARGNATSMTRWVAGGAGLTTTYTYDDAGNRLSATDAAGDATSYSYADNWANGACAPAGGNAASYLTRVTDALGHATSMSYNSCSGTLAARTDANDQTWTWSYDSEGRETGATRPDGGVTTIAYTATTIETRRKINASTWQDHVETLDSLGREADEATETAAGNWMHLTTCRDPATGEPAYASYPFASSTPAGGGTCLDPRDTFTYDALGRPLSVTHSDGTVFNTTYAGRATETQDEGNGNGSARVTRIGQVNALGQLVAVCEVTASAPPAQGPAPAACGLDIAATGYLTDYTPDALGNVLAVVQGVEARAFFYDGLSRLTSASNPESGATSYVYGADGSCAAPDDFPGDLAGRLDARGVLTCYRYDELRRLTGKSYSDGTPAVTYGYDQTTALGVNGLANTAGRMSSEQTAADTAAVFSYDSTGRTAATWQFTPQTWGSSSYNFGDGYDLAGDRLTSVYSRGATLTTAYDLAGRPLSLASSTQGTLISGVTYNARAQETGGTLGNALPMTRGYDQRGRLTSVLVGTASYYVPATPATGWIEVDGDEQSYYRPPLVWDHGSVHVAVNGTDTATVSYGESSDSATLQDSLASDLNGSLVRVDSGGNITTAATGSGANYALTDWSESADPGDFDPPSFEVYTSGPTLTGGADAHWVSGTTDYQLSGVSYAGDGDLLGATDSANGGSIYTYNDLNQLTEACDGGCYGYSYDRYANRWAAATPTSVGATFNNSANRVDGASYDATGNLLAANGCGFTFDAESRLTTVSGCATASYVYDAEGRRVRETVNGVVKEFVYGEGPQGLTVMDGSENLVRQETDFGGQYLGTAAPSGFTWAHTDELGTVRARTNTAGSLAETYTSFPYGEDLNQVGVISNEHFTGKYRDGETSLDNFGARYYASSYGRYLTPDWSASPEPIPYANLGNPQSLNLYSYVLDNPVTETDADGHICCFDWLKKFGGSLYNSTLGAAWNMASHPLATAEGIGFMARHPLIAARGAEQATVTVTQQIGQGNPVAIGTGVGVVGMALIPGGEAGDAAEGAEAAEAATGAVLPAEESQLGHIFREAEGHLPDTPENRALLENVANDPANSLGTAANGTSWSARTLPDGQQVWVQTRGGRIVNGGIINDTPRTSNPSTGLSGGGGL